MNTLIASFQHYTSAFQPTCGANRSNQEITIPYRSPLLDYLHNARRILKAHTHEGVS